MTEEITQPEQAQEATPKTFDAEYVAELRKEAARYRTEAKAGADAVKRLAEIEEAGKSEAQKHADKVAALEAQVADLKKQAEAKDLAVLREQVANAKGVPAKYLTGDDRAALEAAADQFLADIEQLKPGRPPVIPSQGTGDPRARVNSGRARAEAFLKQRSS